ncbi:hypothetical protein TNCT_535691 [Trichonephila clavata]|uniref:CCHC-type domain-containing protein n=1 Tax=Trichonephila clavata TaxID=2740835 RepID=A0A8X6H131_TRICU|nr:hypothetical protein TNCT_535691 [Trichonephila clavata]
MLEANRLQLMKQDLEKTETVCFSNFLSKKKLSKVPRNINTVPGGTTATPADPSGKTEYQKKDGKVFNSKTTKHLKRSSKMIGPCYLCNKYGHLKVNCNEKNSLEKPPSTASETYNTEFNINFRFCEAECSIIELNKHLVTSCNLFEENSDKGVWVIDTAATSHFCNDKSLFLDFRPISNMKMSLATQDKSCPIEGIEENKLVQTINARFDEYRKGVDFKPKTSGYPRLDLNFPDYDDEEDDFDTVRDSLASRLVSKTSTETPTTSCEKPD